MTAKRVTLVVGTVSGGTGAHVRMLAAGLAARGTAVSVAGPASADARFGFSVLPEVAFIPVEFADRPRQTDLAAVIRLRRALRRAGVVHAHGLRAGAFSVLALVGAGGRHRPGLVVTVHNAPPAGRAAALGYRVLERIVARGAGLVLCVSPDLEHRMRAAGARRVGPAVVPAPGLRVSASAKAVTPPSAIPPSAASSSAFPPSAIPRSVPPSSASAIPPSAASSSAIPSSAPSAEKAGKPGLGVVAGERPVVFAAGRLVEQKGFGTLLEAAARWRDLQPPPLVVIAGDGPLAGELRARAAAVGVEVTFLGQRDDVPALLRAAAVFVLPSRWEGQPLVLQEALQAGAAIVATRTGGIPAMTGEDAALLVPPQDAARLAAAVRTVLTDPPLAGRLRAAARDRAARLPSEADAVSAVLAAYAVAGVRGKT